MWCIGTLACRHQGYFQFCDIIRQTEGFTLFLAKVRDCITDLTPPPVKKAYSQAFRLTSIENICLWLGKGSGRKACPVWFQGDNCLQDFVLTSDKTDGTANENVVEIKSAVP